MVTLFPDTNFFLQYRDAPEIPWHEITTESQVVLMVCRTVQGEIDTLKGNGNSRRADRARKVSAKFRTMVLTSSPLMLREANPRVVLDFAPRETHVAREWPAQSRMDDRIVAEVLAAAKLIEGAVSLLTDDTGMMLTARNAQLAFAATPEEWRLPRENDERDREIADLKSQVKRLSRSAPCLELQVSSGTSRLVAELPIQAMDYAPLTTALVEELVEALRLRHPEKTNFSRESDPGYLLHTAQENASFALVSYSLGISGPKTWHPPGEETIARYKEQYLAWLVDARKMLAEVHDRFPDRTRQASLSFSLSNTGTMPTEGLRVDIEALGGLLLSIAPKTDAVMEEQRPSLPAAPQPPAWTFTRSLGIGAGAASISQVMAAMGQGRLNQHAGLAPPIDLPPFSSPEDTYRFYWREKPDRTCVPHWGFRCAEFRHHAEAEIFRTLIVALPGKSIQRGAVSFRASARNLVEPLERIVNIRVNHEAGDTAAAARALMPKPVTPLNLRGRRGPFNLDGSTEN